MFAVSQWSDAREGRSLTQALFPAEQKAARRATKRPAKTPSAAEPPEEASSPATPPPKAGATKEQRDKKRKQMKRLKERARRRAEQAAAAGDAAPDAAGDAERSGEAARRKRAPVDKKWRPNRTRADRRAARSDVPADDADKSTTRKRKKLKTSEGDAATTPAGGPAGHADATDTGGARANGRPRRKKAKTEDAEGDAASGENGGSGAGVAESGQKRLTRKQWQNRTKSKRRMRNKYKRREPVWRKEPEEPGGADEPAEADGAARDASLSKYKVKKLKRRKEKEETRPADAESALDGGAAPVAKIKKNKKRADKSEAKRRKAASPTENGDAPGASAVAAAGKKTKRKPSAATKLAAPDDAEEQEAHAAPDAAPDAAAAPVDRSAALRARMQRRLQGARFRFLNQQLYEGSSRDARALFRADPQAFADYHEGFTAQVQLWPVNPLSRIVSAIKNRPASLVVADFGCGDAQLAASVRNPVNSFDLVALNERVTACDMAKVPLDAASVDVAVFCLSLMGTNIQDFLTEANRVLRKGGVLMIAEVASRFEDSRNFLSALSALGFKLQSKDLEDSHFHLFELQKIGPPRGRESLPGLALKPCVYKKR